ncbi:hypothetical protein MMC2321_05167 [Chitinophaga sp. MM2321]
MFSSWDVKVLIMMLNTFEIFYKNKAIGNNVNG